MTPLKRKKYESILFERYGSESNYILIIKNRKMNRGRFIIFNLQIYTRNMKYFTEHRMSKHEIIQ